MYRRTATHEAHQKAKRLHSRHCTLSLTTSSDQCSHTLRTETQTVRHSGLGRATRQSPTTANSAPSLTLSPTSFSFHPVASEPGPHKRKVHLQYHRSALAASATVQGARAAGVASRGCWIALYLHWMLNHPRLHHPERAIHYRHSTSPSTHHQVGVCVLGRLGSSITACAMGKAQTVHVLSCLTQGDATREAFSLSPHMCHPPGNATRAVAHRVVVAVDGRLLKQSSSIINPTVAGCSGKQAARNLKDCETDRWKG